MNLAKLIFGTLLGQRLPQVEGTAAVAGLEHEVRIHRDAYGVPYIEAQCDRDAWFGLGFCHGQDRAFQLEGLLRAVRGTLSELTGADGLSIDRLARRVGFYRTAQEQWPALSEPVRQWFDAYARGVNSGVRDGCPRLAHEFSLLGAQPTPYTAADALGVIKLVSFSMGASLDNEVLRLKILIDDGPEALRALDPASAQYNLEPLPSLELARNAANKLLKELALFRASMGQADASNNWALAPSRTATGRPILANDPHLSPTLPPYWYLAHVRTPEWRVAGASFVGGPSFPAGHNGFAAWGLTTGAIDNIDLFVQEIGPDGQSVRQGDQFVPCETRRQVIRIKGQKAIEETVLISPQGPIIAPPEGGERIALSMNATWLAPRPLEGMMTLHLARSFEEFRRCFERWPAFSQNMVYADMSGSIGWQLMGEAPQRRQGWGMIPQLGWEQERGWHDDPLPFEQMPHAADPEDGFLATANGPPMGSESNPFLGADWLDSYRQKRIVQVLSERNDWNLADTRALQMDQLSLLWAEVRDSVLDAPTLSPHGILGRDLLAAWDGRVGADSTAASVFELFVAQMIRRALEVKAPVTVSWAWKEGAQHLVARPALSLRRLGYLSHLLNHQPAGWFGGGWPQEMADALCHAVDHLAIHYGPDPERWAWGRVRPLVLRHAAGKRAPLHRVYNLGPFPWGGDACTVGQASVDLACPTTRTFGIATLRMVVDVGNWEQSRFVLPSGQSGNPLSPHYADQHALWRCGKGIPIAWSPEQIEQVTRHTLYLTPAH